MTCYDDIITEFERFKETSTMTHAERPLVRDLLGDLSGLEALDLACGYGYYTRMLADLDAARVVGVDLSEGMLQRAKEYEARVPQGIEYVQGDVMKLPATLGSFDVACAVYLFNYAESREQLQAMIDGISARLRPGGRLVAMTHAMAFEPDGPAWDAYGLHVRDFEAVPGGGRRLLLTALSETPCDLVCYQWPQDVYEAALDQAGFTGPSWTPTPVPADLNDAYEDGYWDAFRANTLTIGLTARKALR
ncbi:class I SAM-dependent methyltransferase [Streptomyces sp. NPDC005760]|uniref:class I SAM-dependent methyltransferase n=1 Tax=Streptomyces sp. NPDC005760 TaxID=3156718 RepID=UPI0033E5BB3F